MGKLKEDLLTRILEASSDGPNWQAFVTWIADEFEEVIEAIVYWLLVGTNKDIAEGIWLGRIGRLVGADRPPNEELYRVFRVRGDSDPKIDNLHGFGTPSNPNIGGFLSGIWGVPADGLAGDALYLDFIDAKIAATNADASVPGIARYLQNAFGLDCTVSASNRVVSVTIGDPFDYQVRRYVGYFAPVVAGVEFRMTNWPGVSE